ncbi:hypothetical protein DTO021C3_8842 [Paecilomyces variotii]|nr:hypothetical protein DTO195F2_7543 [Paecilomyces variotii]KAJ9283583.1 hypothetical protein DTO021C3_8842 [Paecilomyces variotii]KAJ9370569.1 hypothetical protein DTO282E5_4737 [Paecilomyces variotii]
MDISMFARRNYCLTPSRTLPQPFFPCQTVFPLSLNLPFLLFFPFVFSHHRGILFLKRADKIVTISPINRHHPSPSSLVEHV